MKIATFNINNINKRLTNLQAWLESSKPDVVCLQELKAEQKAFPARVLRDLGYEAIWQGERAWNGVAILARNCVPAPSVNGNAAECTIFESRVHRKTLLGFNPRLGLKGRCPSRAQGPALSGFGSSLKATLQKSLATSEPLRFATPATSAWTSGVMSP